MTVNKDVKRWQCRKCEGPNSSARLVCADCGKPRDHADKALEDIPLSDPRTAGASPLAKVAGKWPGDETDEEIMTAMANERDVPATPDALKCGRCADTGRVITSEGVADCSCGYRAAYVPAPAEALPAHCGGHDVHKPTCAACRRDEAERRSASARRKPRQPSPDGHEHHPGGSADWCLACLRRSLQTLRDHSQQVYHSWEQCADSALTEKLVSDLFVISTATPLGIPNDDLSPLAKLVGKWPGNETDEEALAMMKADEGDGAFRGKLQTVLNMHGRPVTDEELLDAVRRSASATDAKVQRALLWLQERAEEGASESGRAAVASHVDTIRSALSDSVSRKDYDDLADTHVKVKRDLLRQLDELRSGSARVEDWTKSEDGRVNSSPLFLHLVERIETKLRETRPDMIPATARLIVAQLAHVHGLTPRAVPCASPTDQEAPNVKPHAVKDLEARDFERVNNPRAADSSSFDQDWKRAKACIEESRTYPSVQLPHAIVALLADVRRETIEACATVAESFSHDDYDADGIAKAIRAGQFASPAK
jgi:hypothetical protein